MHFGPNFWFATYFFAKLKSSKMQLIQIDNKNDKNTRINDKKWVKITY